VSIEGVSATAEAQCAFKAPREAPGGFPTVRHLAGRPSRA
jgi:hypothetical protein